VEYDLAAVRVEDDGKAADRRLGDLPAKSHSQLLQPGQLRVEVGNLEGHHRSTNRDRMLLICRGNCECGVA
jgi:hypothetical protein